MGHPMINPKQLFKQKPIRAEFSYEIKNENFCSSVKPHALIFVVSKSSNYDSRNAIRRTWDNFALNIIDIALMNMANNQLKLEYNYSDTSAIIYGIEIRNAYVVRNSNDQYLVNTCYIVTDDEYPCKNYPLYMSGFGYIVNYNARLKLLCTFFELKNFFICLIRTHADNYGYESSLHNNNKQIDIFERFNTYW
ncbi:unnamed protein product [Rotaria sordida]|uniref:Hexosyltransferase n=1 Tax=Rotaria sordida TaxID=392033 RepID=A0A819BKS4_9BILA|nr:unnamed protein product [Rotaria sordida]CAF3803729.1 unnamed protein product [Rotaria sordida]